MSVPPPLLSSLIKFKASAILATSFGILQDNFEFIQPEQPVHTYG